MEYLTLTGGAQIPQLGLGTFKLQGSSGVRAVKSALQMGYRHLDTAAMYGNHKEVGEALQESDVDRSDVWITSKVWRDSLQHDAVLRECDQALAELGTDYLDLYLIHWPNEDIPLADTLKAFGRLLSEGKIRNAGVANFTVARLKRALSVAEFPLAMNQVEYHPYLNQEHLLTFCQENEIGVTAYCPIARGDVITDPIFQNIAQTHGKTPTQVTLRWLLQKGIVAIPKSGNPDRQRENFEVFGWELNTEEMAQINTIEKQNRLLDLPAAAFWEDE
ncbi:MAG: aldo/keto reductase [Candidatus Latescibacteria bacterium]|nr:aldo/keto reductase [Candidatus Latescibacterota bacterium]MBT4136886.1 aldo/keto reductase [Candidatus Latescibacterota bacterium]